MKSCQLVVRFDLPSTAQASVAGSMPAAALYIVASTSCASLPMQAIWPFTLALLCVEQRKHPATRPAELHPVEGPGPHAQL